MIRALFAGWFALCLVSACGGGDNEDDQWSGSRMVDAGGFDLHVVCEGSGEPTVILDGGINVPVTDWDDVLPALAEMTRTCAYERAGVGESERIPDGSATGEEVIGYMEALLEGADIDPPYVFAAHSAAGLYDRLYQSEHPEDVVGLVFVDASHEEQLDVFPADWADEGYAHIDIQQALVTLGGLDSVGDIPVIVLHAEGTPSDVPELEGVWLEIHQKQAELSTNSHLVSVNSGHFIQVEQPAVVIQALKLVVDAARDDQPLPDCEASFGDPGAECLPVD